MTLAAEIFGLEVWVNDLPAVRLGLSGGRRQPVNEYLVSGPNRIEVRLTSDPLLMGLHDNGRIELQLEERLFDGDELVDSRSLVDQLAQVEPDVFRPGTVLATSNFVVTDPPAAPPLDRATPVGPAEVARIRAKLEEVAGWWRDRRMDAVLAWMVPYIADFVRAYPSETASGYAADFSAMAERFLADGRVLFEPDAVILQPCGQGRAVDCLSSGSRPAIRVLAADGDIYDFWTVVGVVDGEVRLIR